MRLWIRNWFSFYFYVSFTMDRLHICHKSFWAFFFFNHYCQKKNPNNFSGHFLFLGTTTSKFDFVVTRHWEANKTGCVFVCESLSLVFRHTQSFCMQHTHKHLFCAFRCDFSYVHLIYVSMVEEKKWKVPC